MLSQNGAQYILLDCTVLC